MLLFNHYSGFKQELIATSLMISLGVFGSFLLLSQFGVKKNNSNTSQILGIQSLESETSSKPAETLSDEAQGIKDIQTPQTSQEETLPGNLANLQSSASATPRATPQPVELPYGASEEFDTTEFVLSFTNPRLLVTNSRVFKVDVMVGNKTINEGFENVLYATIVDSKDEIISPRVPMNISEKKIVKPGEKITFSASLSIPETMKLSQISFDAKNNGNDILYLLDPTL